MKEQDGATKVLGNVSRRSSTSSSNYDLAHGNIDRVFAQELIDQFRHQAAHGAPPRIQSYNDIFAGDPSG